MKYSTLALLFIICITCQVTRAQTDFWQKTSGPNTTQTFLVRPSGSILAGSAHGGIYRSDDNGSSWNVIATLSIAVNALATGPNSDLFIGTTGGMFRSTDDGVTWQGSGLPSESIEEVVVHGGGTIFARGINTLYRSSDDGATWTVAPVRLVPASPWNNRNSLVITATGDILVANSAKGKSFATVSISRDTGKTWSYLKGFRSWLYRGMNANIMLAADASIVLVYPQMTANMWLVVNIPTNYKASRNWGYVRTSIVSSIIQTSDGIFWAGTWGSGVARSTVPIRRWPLMSSGMTDKIVFALAVTPNGHLLAGESGGLYTSAQQISLSNSMSKAGVDAENVSASYSLARNFPNPFNPTTNIEFELGESAIVTLSVYNTLGQEVAEVIHNELMDGGTQAVEFDASSLSSGVYYYTIVAQEADGPSIVFSDTKKMLLMK